MDHFWESLAAAYTEPVCAREGSPFFLPLLPSKPTTHRWLQERERGGGIPFRRGKKREEGNNWHRGSRTRTKSLPMKGTPCFFLSKTFIANANVVHCYRFVSQHTCVESTLETTKIRSEEEEGKGKSTRRRRKKRRLEGGRKEAHAALARDRSISVGAWQAGWQRGREKGRSRLPSSPSSEARSSAVGPRSHGQGGGNV